MKILILGATGFIGRNILECLQSNKIDVLGTSRKKKNNKIILQYNLGNIIPKYLIDFKPTIIINCVWYGIPNFTKKNALINLSKNIKFLKQLNKFNSLTHFINLGSCKEYGELININYNTHENVKIKPYNDFIWSKKSIHELYDNYFKINKICYSYLRIFYLYGKYQRKNSLIPSIINKFKNKKKFISNNLDSSHDFIHIKDFLNILMIIINKKKYGIFNIGYGKSYKVRDVINLCKHCFNSKNKAPLKIPSTNYNSADIKKINNKLKYTPKINLYEGIKIYIYEK